MGNKTEPNDIIKRLRDSNIGKKHLFL